MPGYNTGPGQDNYGGMDGFGNSTGGNNNGTCVSPDPQPSAEDVYGISPNLGIAAETQKDMNAEAAKAEKEALKATAEATAAAANADPILTVNTAHNAPRIKQEEVILDPKIIA